ncbi:type IV secretion system protein VirB6 [Novosphingobium sp. PhB165]|uniref:type IV secretion system protein n=1 Tax=Novosphingobium sp. PhB165 TaxID=2485105 RepID=UPI0010535A78|nr:type IV secretion system protein [Novosphingobium sp. PhB165]TCM15082.1 type IV secretion system protein VirB6 [Novosphingobium sp. PhB165]
MACPVVHTGEDFLANALAHIDCQAQAIGSYGYGALASPGSPVTIALTSLLTIFIALFGIRLLLGYPMATRDVVGDVLKVGIMLTLATSWPAWRVVGYDLVIHGPGQIAQVIGASAGLPGSAGDLAARLQNVDKGLAAFNTYGSGRLGVAQGDWFQLGFARSAYLVGTLGPLALVRLTAGFLLAVAPLMAGLLLFGITRGIFEGWARALVTTFLASMLLSVIYGVELALLEPWLQDALQRRAADVQTLDAPVEILVAALSFAVASLAGVFLMARLAFHSGFHFTAIFPEASERAEAPAAQRISMTTASGEEPSRAVTVAQAVTDNLRREERIANIARTEGRWAERSGSGTAPSTLAAQASEVGGENALGNTWRRPSRRHSGAARRRDQN